LLIIFLDGVCGDGALGEYLGGEDGLHPPHVVRSHHQLHAQGLQKKNKSRLYRSQNKIGSTWLPVVYDAGRNDFVAGPLPPPTLYLSYAPAVQYRC
jgi:hypothetical protein